jgi:hypothetical protein
VGDQDQASTQDLATEKIVQDRRPTLEMNRPPLPSRVNLR